MKKRTLLTMFIVGMLLLIACSTNSETESYGQTAHAPADSTEESGKPHLNVRFVQCGCPAVFAVGLGSSWCYPDGTCIDADSPHATQLTRQDYALATISMRGMDGEIALHFSRDPQNIISAERWPAEYAFVRTPDGDYDNREQLDAAQETVTVVDFNYISVENTGRDYIYSITADWAEGSITFAFLVIAD